ncbi:hypothetical protein K1719_023705 [Acacia pycnantha]|nr:hypothetical protein K1719_023705 [Acacia pycnantha]
MESTMRNKRSAVSKNSQIEGGDTLNVTHTVRPESQSVNQKKRGKTHLPQIRELATDLCKSLDIPLHENSRATNDQHDTSTPYGVVDNNLTYTFHSNYLDDGDASLECQFCDSQMWFAERLKGLKKNLVAQFGICYCKGKIIVPLLKRPPEELEQLFFNNKDSSHACKKILEKYSFVQQHVFIISFAMMINKSQGQSLSNADLYLPSPIFSHGQLYVAMSRVKNFSSLKILILNKFGKCSNTIINVVYREVFQNLLFH